MILNVYIEQKDCDFLEGLAAQTDMKAAAKKLITRLKKRLPEQLATDSDSLTNNIWKTIFAFCDQLTDCFERQQVNGTAFWQHFEPMMERLLPEGVYNALAKHIVCCELARSYNILLRLDTCSKEETIHHTIELSVLRSRQSVAKCSHSQTYIRVGRDERTRKARPII